MQLLIVSYIFEFGRVISDQFIGLYGVEGQDFSFLFMIIFCYNATIRSEQP